jgi:hypothetical protein
MTLSRPLSRVTAVVVLVLATGSYIFAGERAIDVSSYSWNNIRPTIPFDPNMWAPRAGLQAVELRNDLYVMGGRGPFSFETETQLFGDVWKSSDVGATWTRVAQWQEGQDDPQFIRKAALFCRQTFPVCLSSLPRRFLTRCGVVKTVLTGKPKRLMPLGRVVQVFPRWCTKALSMCSAAAKETTRRPEARVASCLTTFGCHEMVAIGKRL